MDAHHLTAVCALAPCNLLLCTRFHRGCARSESRDSQATAADEEADHVGSTLKEMRKHMWPSSIPASAIVRMCAHESVCARAVLRKIALCASSPHVNQKIECLGGEKKTTIFPRCRTPLPRRHQSRKTVWRPRSPAPAPPLLDFTLQVRIRKGGHGHGHACACPHPYTAPLTFISYLPRAAACMCTYGCGLCAGLPPSPAPFRALDWLPHRGEERIGGGGSSASSSRPTSHARQNARGSSARASNLRSGSVNCSESEGNQDEDEDEEEEEEASDDRALKANGEERGGEEAPEVLEEGAKRVQDSWKGQRHLFHVRELCVQHVLMHMDNINALPMLRFSEECGSDAIKQAACEIILGDFESALATDSFRTLHFRHAREILQSPRLRVQTEEKVCEAAIGWLETHHYDRMQAELELRADLEHKLHSVTIPVLDLDRTSDVIKADCAAMQRQVDDQAAVVAKSKAHLAFLESQLQDHSDELLHNDALLLQSARELGTYRPEDLLVCLYRNPNNAVQMLLVCVHACVCMRVCVCVVVRACAGMCVCFGF